MSKKKAAVQQKAPFLTSSLLIEVSWEVCNQVGGIYTVIRSKTPIAISKWGENYCLLGPYISDNIMAELDPIDSKDEIFGPAVQQMKKQGYKVFYGRWLITGRPKVILFDINSGLGKLDEAKHNLWENLKVRAPASNELINQVLIFNSLVSEFLRIFSKTSKMALPAIICHFHEWMAGLPIIDIKKEKLPIKTVFTTHATQLGRHLAINSPNFYSHLPFFEWQPEAANFGVETEVYIERAAALGCDVFTTVSRLTGRECKYLLDREPDFILPNGIYLKKFEALHEFQNLHTQFMEEIHQFVMGYFFQSYSFDLKETLYFFTSGRYEYKNKGYDLTLEALARLNQRMIKSKSTKTVVMFFVTRQPTHTIHPDVLQSRAVMEEIRHNCESIKEQVGKRLFYASTSNEDTRLPQLNEFVGDYWKLRYRRTVQSWRTRRKPSISTHILKDERGDDIMNYVRHSNLTNDEATKVKIVYHPDFITSTNPLFGMDYSDFVRGCHLGIFPSYYEPWGYTPLECGASGIPAVTSDLAGFGDYVLEHMPDYDQKGMFVLKRDQKSFDESADQLAEILFQFIQQDRRERILQRNAVENASVMFGWRYLMDHYQEAYQTALNS